MHACISELWGQRQEDHGEGRVCCHQPCSRFSGTSCLMGIRRERDRHRETETFSGLWAHMGTHTHTHTFSLSHTPHIHCPSPHMSILLFFLRLTLLCLNIPLFSQASLWLTPFCPHSSSRLTGCRWFSLTSPIQCTTD